ncbi:MAG: hypothetical protein J6Z27_05090 [Bacteroidales bacterium]|nr:hypothetical protein [Bacteroidales bacterium]
MQEENGVAFTVTDLVPVDTCSLRELIGRRTDIYNQTIKVYNGPLFDNSEEAVADKIAQTKYLANELKALQKKLEGKMDKPAYIDYRFSAVPKSNDNGVSYEDVYCCISTTGNKVLGIGGRLSSIHKNVELAIPKFEEVLKKAETIKAETK